MPRLRVLFFASIADAAGTRSLNVALSDDDRPATVARLAAHLGETNERLRPLLSSVAFAVNERYAARTTALADGDTVALIPPVSGG